MALPVRESSFTHLSTDEGLSQETVLSIVQDRIGCIWIASYNGLNCYDGYDIRVFKTEDDLPGNTVLKLYCDSYGQLWIGTQQGIARMDPAERKITQVNQDSYHLIYDFVETSDSTLWIATSKGILEALTSAEHPALTAVHSPQVITAFACANGSLYAGDATGHLYSVNTQDLSFQAVSLDLGGKQISKILCEDNYLLWIATDGNGLFCYNLKTGHLNHYCHEDAQDEGGLCSNYVQTLCLDSIHNLWIGTGNRLCIRSRVDDSFITIEHDPLRYESLSQNSIWALLADTCGGIWLGTFYGGVNYYHPQRDIFRTLKLAYSGGEMIGGICEGPDNTLWLGTNRNGIRQVDLKRGLVRRINLLKSENLEDAEKNDVKAIVFSKDGKRAYCGTTLGGLNRIDLKDGKLTHISQDATLPGAVYTIIPETEGRFWVGGENGLCLYNERDGTLQKIELQQLGGALIVSLHRDSAGFLWVGTEHKLICCTINLSANPEDIVVKEDVFNYTWVNDIHESRTRDLWFVSAEGLIRYSPLNEAWKQYKMPENVVLLGVEEDLSGRLWLTSDRKLFLFGPEDETIRDFSMKDGITKGPYGTYAHFRGHDGTLYFGGRNGVSCFHPESVIKNDLSPAPLIKELRINGDKEAKNLLSTRRIDLGPDCTAFTIRFSCPDYLSWQQSKFYYRLEGMDSDWVEADDSRTARYSYVPAGRYRFRLRSSNCDGVPSAKEAVIDLIVHPVWYLTLFARIVWILLLSAIILSILYLLWKKYQLLHRKEIDRITRQTKHELGFLKMQSMLHIKEEELDSKSLDFLTEAFQIVMEHLADENFSMNDFASAMNMSRTSLHLRVKELTGKSALEFVKRIRFQEAKRLLKENLYSVADVGYQVGFSSASYFVSNFRKYFGITPKEFAENNRKHNNPKEL